MKKLSVLFVLCLLLFTACGREGSKEYGTNSEVIKGSGAVSSESPIESENLVEDDREYGTTAEDIRANFGGADQWIRVFPVQSAIPDGYNYYIVYEHIGIDEDGTFKMANILNTNFKIDLGDTGTDLYPWQTIKLVSNSNDYGLHLLVVKDKYTLNSVNLVWSNLTVTCDTIGEGEKLSMYGGIEGGDNLLFPLQEIPYEVDGLWVYTKDYSYHNGVKTGGDLTAFPIAVLGGNMQDVREYTSDHMKFAYITGIDEHFNRMYEVFDEPTAEIYLYGEDGIGFEWSALDGRMRSEYPLESYLYVRYDFDDKGYEDSAIAFGVELPEGEIIWLGSLEYGD